MDCPASSAKHISCPEHRQAGGVFTGPVRIVRYGMMLSIARFWSGGSILHSTTLCNLFRSSDSTTKGPGGHHEAHVLLAIISVAQLLLSPTPALSKVGEKAWDGVIIDRPSVYDASSYSSFHRRQSPHLVLRSLQCHQRRRYLLHYYNRTHGFVADPPDFRVRLLRSATPDSLLVDWELLAEWDIDDSAEATNIEPSLARGENGSLFIDENGWLYVFMTVGKWKPAFNSWAIAQARYRVIEPTGKTIADTFANMGPRRQLDEPLNGKWLEAGSHRWTADNQLVFSTDGSIVSSNMSADTLANIPFARKPGSSASTLEARVDLTGSEWMALGFTDDPDSGLFQGQIFIQLHALTANVQVLADGQSNSLVRIPAPSLSTNFNHLILEVDHDGNTDSAWCNGVQILDRFALDTLNGGAGFTPNIRYAVFQIFRPAARISRVDDFAISQERYLFLDNFESGDLSKWSALSIASEDYGRHLCGQETRSGSIHRLSVDK